MGVISFNTFENIDRVRSVRNKIVHRRHECSLEEATTALNLVRDIIQEKSGVDIHPDLSQFVST